MDPDAAEAEWTRAAVMTLKELHAATTLEEGAVEKYYQMQVPSSRAVPTSSLLTALPRDSNTQKTLATLKSPTQNMSRQPRR